MMLSARNKIYYLLLLAIIIGTTWIIFNYSSYGAEKEGITTPCPIKLTTGIACPSCGTTRSILSVLHGDVFDALYWNPIGIILLFVLIVFPVWIVYDLILKKESFLMFYRRVENLLKQKRIAIPAIVLIIVNWIWNIYKGL